MKVAMIDNGIESTDILHRLRILIYCDPSNLPVQWYINYRLLKKHLPGGIGVDIFYLNKYTINAYSRSLIEVIQDFSNQAYDQLDDFAKTHNFDIVYDPEKVLVDDQIPANVHQPFIICIDQGNLSNYINAFLAGKNIVWSFENPLLRLSWIYKYARTDRGLTYNANTLYEKLPNDRPDITNTTRSLVGKCMQVEYTRDMLSYNLMKINYERRNYSSKITRSEFEFGVHLTNYYSLISSVFEILATVIYLKNKIPLSTTKTIDISMKSFRKEIKAYNVALFNLYKIKENRDWTSWINQVRNYLAHSGYAFISPLIREPEEGIDNELVRQEAQSALQSMFGDQRSAELGDEAYEYILNVLEDEIRVSKHEVLAVDTMTIEDRNGNKKLFRPFFHVDKDYRKLHDLIRATQSLL